MSEVFAGRRPPIKLAGHSFLPVAAGALYWESEDTLLVADLHLEKGAAFAARGTMLPPYDTRSTLQRLAACLDHFSPRRVVALGDSFHRSELAGWLSGSAPTIAKNWRRCGKAATGTGSSAITILTCPKASAALSAAR